MKLALVLVLVLGCSGKPKQSDEPPRRPGHQHRPPRRLPRQARSAAGPAVPPGTPPAGKPQYSCFSYIRQDQHCAASGMLAQRRLPRTTSSRPKSVPVGDGLHGLRDGCDGLLLPSTGTKDDPDGQDICQPRSTSARPAAPM